MRRKGVGLLATSAATAVLLVSSAVAAQSALRTSSVPATTSPSSSLTSSSLASSSLIARSLPRVTYRGGSFLRQPRIVTVTFEGDDPGLVAQLERFGDRIARTSWWRAVSEGYCAAPGDCIGAGRPGLTLRLRGPIPRSVTDLTIGTRLQDALVKWPKRKLVDSDTLFMVYLPADVRLSDELGGANCAPGSRPARRLLQLPERHVPLAIVPRCGGLAELTAVAAREILKASTNPDPTARGFAFDRTATSLGFTAAGIEPADPCGILAQARAPYMENGFVLPRGWSNRAASLGRDPCVPAGSARYLALVPRTPTVQLTREGDVVTIVLDAVADRLGSRWQVAARDLTDDGAGDYLEVALDRERATAGETVTLTVTLLKHSEQRLGIVGVISTAGERSHVWPIAVVMR